MSKWQGWSAIFMSSRSCIPISYVQEERTSVHPPMINIWHTLCQSWWFRYCKGFGDNVIKTNLGIIISLLWWLCYIVCYKVIEYQIIGPASWPRLTYKQITGNIAWSLLITTLTYIFSHSGKVGHTFNVL